MIAGGERTTLLREAQRELTEAKRVDPRDPRTALDLSQLYRLAGDLDAAAKHAMSAASVEPVRGPASRALAAILVEQGRKALDANAWDQATGLASAASKADPLAAAADLLAGDVANARQDLNAALAAYARAHEKSPADPGIRAALAACHRQRGAAFFLAQQMRPRPKAAADGTPADPAKVAAHDAWFEKNVRGAAREYQQAIELEPDGPFADDDREKLAHLRGLDPATSGANLAAARALFEQGEALRRDARPEEALVRYQEAATAYPEFVFAWLRVAELAARLGRDHDLVGIQAVDRLRALDRERAYPEVDLYAAEILVRIGREAAGDAARQDVVATAAAQARVALDRFVAGAEATGKPTERGGREPRTGQGPQGAVGLAPHARTGPRAPDGPEAPTGPTPSRRAGRPPRPAAGRGRPPRSAAARTARRRCPRRATRPPARRRTAPADGDRGRRARGRPRAGVPPAVAPDRPGPVDGGRDAPSRPRPTGRRRRRRRPVRRRRGHAARDARRRGAGRRRRRPRRSRAGPGPAPRRRRRNGLARRGARGRPRRDARGAGRPCGRALAHHPRQRRRRAPRGPAPRTVHTTRRRGRQGERPRAPARGPPARDGDGGARRPRPVDPRGPRHRPGPPVARRRARRGAAGDVARGPGRRLPRRRSSRSSTPPARAGRASGRVPCGRRRRPRPPPRSRSSARDPTGAPVPGSGSARGLLICGRWPASASS